MTPADPRRVALVHDWLTGMRGGEMVLEELCRLFPAAPIFTLFHFPGAVSQEIESHPITTTFLQHAPFLRRHYRRYLPFFPAAIEGLDLAGFELVISTSHCVAKGVRPPAGAEHLCYCFTPVRYAWDQEHAYFPRRRGLLARLRGLVLARLRAWDVASAARVDRFHAISEFVAERIARYYRREAVVIHPPVDVDFFTPDAAPRREFCLAVSALVPYKRLELAIAACERSGVDLVVVGTGPERRRLERQAGARTRFLGRVSRDRLRELYRTARCLVQPGVEDFGISSVEALACGTPVVALARGGVLDIVRDGREGILFSAEGDARALAEAIDKCRAIRFNELNLRGRAELFSAERFRERMRAALAARESHLEGTGS